jgi:serine/threonine-protein kinase PRP4
MDGGRYKVFSSLGKGMFSCVVKARVIEPGGVIVDGDEGREVAVKIVRAQESM